MYLRLPLGTATAGYNRSAALWISMFAFTLMPSETACSVWNQERAVVGPCPLHLFWHISNPWLAGVLVNRQSILCASAAAWCKCLCAGSDVQFEGGGLLPPTQTLN